MESDGLLDTITKVHSLVLRRIPEPDDGPYCVDEWEWDRLSTTDADIGHRCIQQALDKMSEADELIGHNIIEFDLPALEKVYGFRPKPGCKITDTLTLSRLIWPDIGTDDHAEIAKKKLPAKLMGRYSLEAWGYRLGVYKGDYGKTADWTRWTPEMQRYCEQDVIVTLELYNAIQRKNYSPVAMKLELDFASIIQKMCARGFAFNQTKAAQLYSVLIAKRDAIETEIQRVFPPETIEYETPKKKQKRTKVVAFNPRSRVQVAKKLESLGWVPTEFTPTGQPKIDDDVLEAVPYESCKPLAELFLLNKLLGMLAVGEQAWMLVEKKGRIHSRVISGGAVTGRCTHSQPNIAQVPKVTKPYGKECRGLFGPSPGMVLVGADASGLELRCLAHYLYPLDGGSYVEAVTVGDVHTTNQKAFGLPPGKPGRDKSKTGIYCHNYGGGDEKLGWSLGPLDPIHEATAQAAHLTDRHAAGFVKELTGEWPRKVTADHWRLIKAKIPAHRIADTKRGAYARKAVGTGITGLGLLIEKIQALIDKKSELFRGYLIGVDGRRLRIRSKHAALNTLLQSAGALAVKMATVIWYNTLISEGLVWGVDFALVAHIHDEIQAESKPEHADRVGRAFVEAMQEAGRVLKFLCPLTGEYKIGADWAETH